MISVAWCEHPSPNWNIVGRMESGNTDNVSRRALDLGNDEDGEDCGGKPQPAEVRPRGRPRATPASNQAPNRIRELRDMRGLSQEELGDRVGLSQQQIGSLERGQRGLTLVATQKLAHALEVAPADLLPDVVGVSVPVAMIAASSFDEARPDSFDIAGPHNWVKPTSAVKRPQNCFAIRVIDQHCDRLYPAGSLLVVRRLEAQDGPIPIGAKVAVRHYRSNRGGGETMEILIGVVDRPVTGDLSIHIRSTRRDMPGAVTIQAAPRGNSGLGETGYLDLPREREIHYAPTDNDPAEILGVVVEAITPE